MASNASWGEFQAVRRRQRSVVEHPPGTKLAGGAEAAGAGAGASGSAATQAGSSAAASDKVGAKPAASAAGANTSGTSGTSTTNASSGNGRMAFVVTPAAKAVMLALVTLDCVAAIVRLLLHSGAIPAVAGLSLALEVVWRLCFCVSVLEMLVCAVRAPLGYVSSTWRMADMALIGLQGHYGHTLQRPGAHLISLLRLWRVWDLVRDVVTRLRVEKEAMAAQLALQRKRLAAMEARVEQATSKWQRESETRLRTEAQMERYKSEADTLREALSIAAQEQVLQGDLLAEMGVGDEELPTADDLARLDASTASRFVVAPDGSYLKQQVQVPVEVGTRHTGAGAGPR